MSTLRCIKGELFEVSHSIDKCPKESDFTSHIHDGYELFCLVKGDVDYIVEGNLYKLKQGAIMLMRSSETHNLVVNKSMEYERYVLSFMPNFILSNGFSRELLSPYRERGLGEKNLYLDDEFEHISPLLFFEKIFKEAEYISEKDAVLSNLASLLCEIKIAFDKKGEIKNETNQKENEIISFVNDNLTKDITIQTIANHLHMSESQVSRVFKKATGTSVHNYIITKRLILFNKKISKGKGITQACHECGFHDYSSFYRLYKKRFGHPPAKPTEK